MSNLWLLRIIKVLLLTSFYFSVLYFVMAICQLLHIGYNKLFPNRDWISIPKGVKLQPIHPRHHSGIWIVINFILLVFLLILFPILHI